MSTLVIVAAVGFVSMGCSTAGDYFSVADSVEYACPVCDTGFMSEAEWKEHVKNHHPGKRPVRVLDVKKTRAGDVKIKYDCPVCDTGYMSAAEWDDYASRERPGKKGAFPTFRLKNVVKTDRGSEVHYACALCDTGFITRDQWDTRHSPHK